MAAHMDGVEPMLQRPNLKQAVADVVRDDILAGRLQAGQRIDQDLVAMKAGTSRAPVREALISLEAEGLVNNVPRRGAFVAQLSTEDIIDHYEMFGLISGLAAKRAVESGDRSVIAELKQLNAAMESCTDPSERDRLNYDFHRVIHRSSSSGRLLAVLRTLSKSMPTHFFRDGAPTADAVDYVDEHAAIIAAMEAGDGELASNLMVGHFRHTGERAVAALKSVGFWADATS